MSLTLYNLLNYLKSGEFNIEDKKIKKLVLCALFAAVCFAVTRLIMFPTFFTRGYVNIGDSIVLLSAYILGGPWAAVASGIGSALSDLSSGYLIYAPATFVIKAAMALVAYVFYKRSFSAKSKTLSFLYILLGSVSAEIIMTAGYLIYEIPLYGAAAFASVIGNLIQGAVSLIISVILIYIFSQNDDLKKYIKK